MAKKPEKSAESETPPQVDTHSDPVPPDPPSASEMALRNLNSANKVYSGIAISEVAVKAKKGGADK